MAGAKVGIVPQSSVDKIMGKEKEVTLNAADDCGNLLR